MSQNFEQPPPDTPTNSKNEGAENIVSESKGPKSEESKSEGAESIESQSKGPKSEESKSEGAESIESQSKGPKSEESKSEGAESIESQSIGPKSEESKNEGIESIESQRKEPKSEESKSEGAESIESQRKGPKSEESKIEGTESRGSESKGPKSEESKIEGAERIASESNGAKNEGSKSEESKRQGSKNEESKIKKNKSQGSKSEGSKSRGTKTHESKGERSTREAYKSQRSKDEGFFKVPEESSVVQLPKIKITVHAGKKVTSVKYQQKSPEKHHGMPWMTYNCPLAREQKLPEGSRMEDKTDPKSRETGFVVDCVPSAVYGKLPGHSVIPPYNAVKDKYASAYFQSPTVRAIMERNQQLRELKNERNKLSTRNRCKATPPADELRKRRDQFIVDAVKVEHARSRFYDIIPPYQASDDQNCRKYFQRSDVKKLLKVTLTPRP